MATIKDISKLAQVSPGTVSRALSQIKVSTLPRKLVIRSGE
nr:LacI family DNA-binding transcriptional regulator [Lentilactobacillus otakiensis]